MSKISPTILFTVVMLFAVAPTQVQSSTLPTYIKIVVAEFDDVVDELENAIIEKGSRIDYVGNVDQMLERTATTVDSDDASTEKSIYVHARYMQFCSAPLTHKAVRANPQNLSMCPFVVFVFETRENPGKISVGYRPPTLSQDDQSAAVFQEVITFLQEILDEVVSNY